MTAMGAVLSVFFGLGFVLLSHIQTLATGDQGGIAKFIYGQTAAMTARGDRPSPAWRCWRRPASRCCSRSSASSASIPDSPTRKAGR